MKYLGNNRKSLTKVYSLRLEYTDFATSYCVPDRTIRQSSVIEDF